ncbi:MAG: hypothetical protein ABEK03_06245 [Candidatus Bipolaricaulia bacterium]
MMRDTMTIYFPQEQQEQDVLSRLQKLAQSKDRSVNYVAVQAILDYVEQAERSD